jgi:hypothetical protein
LVSLSQFIGLFNIAHGLDKDIRQIFPNGFGVNIQFK